MKQNFSEECRLLGCYAMWLLRTNVSEERIASIIRMTRIGEHAANYSIVFLRSVLRFPVIANVVLSSLIVFTLKMETIRCSESRFLQQPHG
jgi:hypothetical protein